MSTCLQSIRSRMLPWQGLTVSQRWFIYSWPLASLLLASVYAMGPGYEWTPFTRFCACFIATNMVFVVCNRAIHGDAHKELVDRANAFDMLTAAFMWLLWFGVYSIRF